MKANSSIILSKCLSGALRLQNEDMLKELDAWKLYTIYEDTIDFSNCLVNFKNENKNEYKGWNVSLTVLPFSISEFEGAFNV